MVPQTALELRVPKELPTPVTQNACDVLPFKAQGSLSWEWEQPSHNYLPWQQGGTWMHTEGKYQDIPVPAAPYAIP